MANTTYDNLWQQAMGELSEQLHVEGVDDGGDDGGGGQHEVSDMALSLPVDLPHFLTKLFEFVLIFRVPKMSRFSRRFNTSRACISSTCKYLGSWKTVMIA